MGHNKFALDILIILLVASVSACASDLSNSQSTDPSGPSGLPAPGTYRERVQGIAQAVSDWEQVNSNGFGDPGTGEVSALESFNGFLYAGTYNPIDPALLYDGAQIFRSPDGVTWTPVTQPGFGNSHDIAPPAILDFIVFNNQLYAGTGRGNASQIWRTSNGTIWAPMDVTGFSDPDNVDITALAVYNGKIYAGVRNQVTGAQIWSSFTGDNNSWTQVAPDMPGTVPASVTGFAEFAFDGGLYAAVESEEGPAQIWRSYGGPWEVIVNDGFGDANTLLTGGIAEFGEYLYVGSGNTADGAQLWRTNDGMTWGQAIGPGFGGPNNQKVEAVFAFQNQLYVSVKNTVTGMEIWRSTDGVLWEQANLDGFGDSNNSGTNLNNATADFLSQLYVGTSNLVDGGELWRTLQPTTVTNTPTSTATNIPSATPTITSTLTPSYTLTSTGTLTFTPTFTATNTLVIPPTFTPSHTPANTLSFTPTNTTVYTSTPTPTATLTFTSTNTSTKTATNTPTNTPSNTPTATPRSSTPGKVTGGGNIDLSGGKVTFGFVIQYKAGATRPTGNLTFIDHSADLSLKVTSFDLLVIESNHAWFTGKGEMKDGQIVNFEIKTNDLNKLDQQDRFYIFITEVYGDGIGGELNGGNITIHK